MHEISQIESILHLGPLGLLSALISMVSAIWLFVARLMGIFRPARIDTVREMALLFVGPIGVSFYTAAFLAGRINVYLWGTGVDTDFSLKYGLHDIAVLFEIGLFSFLIASIAACLPRKNKNES